MGRCIAIEAARARRALQDASAPRVSAGRDRIKGSQARRLDRARTGIWWSLSGWLWSEIRKTLAEAHSGIEPQSRSAAPAGKPGADKRQRELGQAAFNDATSPHNF